MCSSLCSRATAARTTAHCSALASIGGTKKARFVPAAAALMEAKSLRSATASCAPSLASRSLRASLRRTTARTGHPAASSCVHTIPPILPPAAVTSTSGFVAFETSPILSVLSAVHTAATAAASTRRNGAARRRGLLRAMAAVAAVAAAAPPSGGGGCGPGGATLLTQSQQVALRHVRVALVTPRPTRAYRWYVRRPSGVLRGHTPHHVGASATCGGVSAVARTRRRQGAGRAAVCVGVCC